MSHASPKTPQKSKVTVNTVETKNNANNGKEHKNGLLRGLGLKCFVASARIKKRGKPRFFCPASARLPNGKPAI